MEYPRDNLSQIGKHEIRNLCFTLSIFSSVATDLLNREFHILCWITTGLRNPARCNDKLCLNRTKYDKLCFFIIATLSILQVQ